MDQSNKPCLKCKGQGVLDSVFLREMQCFMKEQVRLYAADNFQQMLAEFLKEKALMESSV